MVKISDKLIIIVLKSPVCWILYEFFCENDDERSRKNLPATIATAHQATEIYRERKTSASHNCCNLIG